MAQSFNIERTMDKQNYSEKEVLELFTKTFSKHELSQIVFGTKPNGEVKNHLTDREESVVLSVIQWLGSPVGQGFINKISNNEGK